MERFCLELTYMEVTEEYEIEKIHENLSQRVSVWYYQSNESTLFDRRVV
jgi:hypothetical protein